LYLQKLLTEWLELDHQGIFLNHFGDIASATRLCGTPAERCQIDIDRQAAVRTIPEMGS